MRKIHKIFPLVVLMGGMVAASCSGDWDDHYDQQDVTIVNGTNVNSYQGDIASYLASAGDATKAMAVLQSQGVFNDTKENGQYTFVICDDAHFDESKIVDAKRFAQLSVADMGVMPSKLINGYNIETRAGKSIWVYDDGKQLDKHNITKIVKTNNGYVYYIDGMLEVHPSAYELLMSLGDEYSTFKQMVLQYDSKTFDSEHSQIISVSSDGRNIYDSVWVIKNSMMDRYDENGIETWNMRSESYNTSIFIPTNDQIKKAIDDACDSIPVWLNRASTAADTAKFKQWIIKACFSNRRLEAQDVNTAAADFKCVEGYQEIIDVASDAVSYKSIDPAWWRPAVQKVDVANAITLSNGMAYYCQTLKIPNHIVIYRVKSRFYELWDECNDDQKKQYFRWTNFVDPMIIKDCQGQFDLVASGSAEWPSIFYHNLCAIPSAEAMEEGRPCTVEYDGLLYNESTGQLAECHLPAGEYYLRMGFKHSLLYSLSIAFNNRWLVEDMCMHAQGSNFHFDRGAASEVPHLGEDIGIAYPEGFDVDYWQTQNEKAIAYDTDGYTVGVVNMPTSGNFTIRVTSNNMAQLYKEALDRGTVLNRDKNNVNQLMMYHWCLRPTHNNY